MEQLHVTEGRLQFVDIGIWNSFDTAQKLKIKNVLHPKINDIFWDRDFELNLSGVHNQSNDCLNSGSFEIIYDGLHKCGQSWF